jgi:hypothetical protein
VGLIAARPVFARPRATPPDLYFFAKIQGSSTLRLWPILSVCPGNDAT